jgi:hypothetical protein
MVCLRTQTTEFSFFYNSVRYSVATDLCRVQRKTKKKSNLLVYFISCKFTIYSTNGAISKYVIRKHLCEADFFTLKCLCIFGSLCIALYYLESEYANQYTDGLRGCTPGVWFSAGKGAFLWDLPASYPMCIGGNLPGGKADGAQSWPIVFI